MTATGKQKYIQKIIKKRAIHERHNEQTKEEPHRQQGGSIHRQTQIHNSTQKQCSYFITGKQTKIFIKMHQKIENKEK